MSSAGSRTGLLLLLLSVTVVGGCSPPPPAEQGRWIGTWAAAPQLPEAHNVPPEPGLSGNTLRQVVRISVGGRRFRLRLSNAFGRNPLHIDEVRIAASAGGGRIVPETDRALSFAGRPGVIIPAGAPFWSDPVELELAPLTCLAISMVVGWAPDEITAHPGSRTTSYLKSGRHASAVELPDPVLFERWYLINGIDAWTVEGAGSVAVLGDSITDGRGSTSNENRRWPDFLAARLVDLPTIGVLNLGIGGNRVLADGLGPSLLSRLDRDVIAQSGVRAVILLEGINDIGTSNLETAGAIDDLFHRLTAAYRQIVIRCRAKGLAIYGGTLTPMGGSFYFTEGRETVRQRINEWVRSSGAFDGVVDFDRAVRDPDNPGRLLPAFDSGDHLHLNDAGYESMARSIDLSPLLRPFHFPDRDSVANWNLPSSSNRQSGVTE